LKALQLTKYGDVQTSVALRDIEEPLRADHQVLITVRAAATNPIDWAIAEGRFKPIIKLSLPCTLGFDVSGEIVSTGRDVDGLTVGNRVFARVHEDDIGTFAEYAAVDAGTVAHMPANIGFREAAGLPLVGATVIQAFEKASLVPGDRVLIHAGSGGVGSFAVQIAKTIGHDVETRAGRTGPMVLAQMEHRIVARHLHVERRPVLDAIPKLFGRHVQMLDALGERPSIRIAPVRPSFQWYRLHQPIEPVRCRVEVVDDWLERHAALRLLVYGGGGSRSGKTSGSAPAAFFAACPIPR